MLPAGLSNSYLQPKTPDSPNDGQTTGFMQAHLAYNGRLYRDKPEHYRRIGQCA